MWKKLINISFVYLIAALASGVFYREFTKYMQFTGRTALAFTHLHLFALGALLFLILAGLSVVSDMGEQKNFRHFLKLYNFALPSMVMMLYVRGIPQALGMELSRGVSKAISGVAGISHIFLTVALVYLYSALKKSNPAIRNSEALN